MEYRQVGNIELRVSEIGFGCGGNAGLMVRGSPEEQRRVVTRAVELGINYFDNAPDYGNGVAEENLGRVLKELKLRPVITSKVEVRHTDLGDIAGHVVRSTEESLQRLGVDYVDILQIHNGPAPSPPQVVLGGFSALDHLGEIVPVSGAGPLAPELMARVEMVWRANFGFAGPPPPAGGG